MTTTRSVRDDVKHVLDYLLEAELAVYVNEVSIGDSRVAWHSLDPRASFLISRDHATLEQYLQWVTTGAYSAILYDGSLLQVTYDVEHGQVTGHRLAYIPCPFMIDTELLKEGEPLADIVEVYRDYRSQEMALRSPVRFDYDPVAAKAGHPAAHMTVNSANCRIACAAPMHVFRFVDFVFRNFYPAMHTAHRDFFTNANTRHVGSRVIVEADSIHPHLMWQFNAMTNK